MSMFVVRNAYFLKVKKDEKKYVIPFIFQTLQNNWILKGVQIVQQPLSNI